MALKDTLQHQIEYEKRYQDIQKTLSEYEKKQEENAQLIKDLQIKKEVIDEKGFDSIQKNLIECKQKQTENAQLIKEYKNGVSLNVLVQFLQKQNAELQEEIEKLTARLKQRPAVDCKNSKKNTMLK